MKVRNFYIESMEPNFGGGFMAYLSNVNNGKFFRVEYSHLTEKFYGQAIPKYLQTALMERAKNKGFKI